MNFAIIILRLAIAFACGAVIGAEREIRDKAAGLRTHILVCLGACLFGILGMSIVSICPEADMLRLAQGLLIGIGFLGAGVIVREGASVRGLTTAAGVWVLGAIGLATGIGMYQVAIAGTVFIFLTIALFGRIERKLKK